MVYFCMHSFCFVSTFHLCSIFSVREKPSDKRSSACFILSLCFQREYHHYIIQKTPDDYLQVASANKSARVNRFGSLAQVCSITR